MKAFETWTVLPHGPIEKLSENLWRAEGSLPGMPLKRVLTVARRSDGELVLHNPIALDEQSMRELEAFGRPAWLVVPNGWHRLDSKVFAERYPRAKVLCPPAARKKVGEVTRVDGSYCDFPADAAVSLELLDGVADAEGVMKVLSSDGATLVFNDALFNQPHLPGLFGLIYRLMGQSGRPKVPAVMRLIMVKDRKAFRAHLERLAATPRLRRIIVSHSTIIDADAPAVLGEVAAAL